MTDHNRTDDPDHNRTDDPDAGTAASAGSGAGGGLDGEEGRYLYCAVYADDDATFSAEGLAGGRVSVVVEDGIGAIVQPVESVFDSEDLTQVREWLLAHQQVVDDAGTAFGTPLPVRFDTILRGDDATVREWLDDHDAEIDDVLARLAGRWEYRIEVRWDEAAVTEEVRADGDLQALASRAEDASEGTGFLLESQYETRLAERLEERRREVEAGLVERLEPHAVEVQRTGNGEGVFSATDDDLETVTRLSVLADRDEETAVGEQLEPIADRPDHDVRFTGPWPPYSFAPEIGGEG